MTVRDDRLYLLSVVGRYRLIGEEPLLDDWFSGTLTVPCASWSSTCTWASGRSTRPRFTSTSSAESYWGDTDATTRVAPSTSIG